MKPAYGGTSQELLLAYEIRRNSEIVALTASLHGIPGCDRQCGRLATWQMGLYAPMCDEHRAEFTPHDAVNGQREFPGAKRIRRLEELLTGESR